MVSRQRMTVCHLSTEYLPTPTGSRLRVPRGGKLAKYWKAAWFLLDTMEFPILQKLSSFLNTIHSTSSSVFLKFRTGRNCSANNSSQRIVYCPRCSCLGSPRYYYIGGSHKSPGVLEEYEWLEPCDCPSKHSSTPTCRSNHSNAQNPNLHCLTTQCPNPQRMSLTPQAWVPQAPKRLWRPLRVPPLRRNQASGPGLLTKYPSSAPREVSPSQLFRFCSSSGAAWLDWLRCAIGIAMALRRRGLKQQAAPM